MAARVRFCHCGRAATEFKGVRGFEVQASWYRTSTTISAVVPAGAAEVFEADAEDDGGAHAAMDLSADDDGVVPDDDAAATYVLGSATDDLIGRLYMTHPGMTVSLLDDYKYPMRCKLDCANSTCWRLYCNTHNDRAGQVKWAYTRARKVVIVHTCSS